MRSKVLVGSMVIVGFVSVLLLQLYAAPPVVTVYKDPYCGCCEAWVKHLEANGFEVKVHEVENMDQQKRTYGVPVSLKSCHTAVVDGYTIEGHVPAAEIQRLLKERPKAKGLAVPGMPIGSPGMESGSTIQRYAVLLFNTDGTSSVYKQYQGR
jgi:hypothetical protein